MKGRSVAALVCVAGVLSPVVARAIDFNFAGTLQLDYLFVPFGSGLARPARSTFDGFTEELGLKVAADLSPHVTVNAKVCYGCHGFEVGMAFVDLRVNESVTVRAGRFFAHLRRVWHPPRPGQSPPPRQAPALRHGPACCAS
jgi:hypothetical protein